MSANQLLVVDDTTLNHIVLKLNYTSIKHFEEDVNTVKKWLEQQPHLPEIMDDKRIQNFLIMNKGSVERTKQKIDNYYTIRSQLPQVFDEINPKYPYMKHILDAVYIVPLPKLTKEMYRVVLFKTKSRSLMNNYDAIAGIRYLINAQEVRLLEDVMYGDIVLLDGKDLPARVVLQLTPTIVYTMIVTLYEKVFSSRMKALYIVNSPPFMDKILFLIKAALKPKLISRIHILDNYDQLIDHIGKDVLPKDYGGDEKSVFELQEMIKQVVQDNKHHFDRLDKLRVDEKVRPEGLRNDDVLGFYGNFKKLEID